MIFPSSSVVVVPETCTYAPSILTARDSLILFPYCSGINIDSFTSSHDFIEMIWRYIDRVVIGIQATYV